jgi:hypothetical protein
MCKYLEHFDVIPMKHNDEIDLFFCCLDYNDIKIIIDDNPQCIRKLFQSLIDKYSKVRIFLSSKKDEVVNVLSAERVSKKINKFSGIIWQRMAYTSDGAKLLSEKKLFHEFVEFLTNGYIVPSDPVLRQRRYRIKRNIINNGKIWYPNHILIITASAIITLCIALIGAAIFPFIIWEKTVWAVAPVAGIGIAAFLFYLAGELAHRYKRSLSINYID